MKLSSLIEKIFDKEKIKSKKIIVMILVFAVGIAFLTVPQEKSLKDDDNIFFDIEKTRREEEQKLSQMLSKVKGTEYAKVYISYDDNGSIEYLNEEKSVIKKNTKEIAFDSESQTEKKPVYNKNKDTVVKRVFSPSIGSVCIFYKGVDDEETKSRLIRGAKGALGIGPDKIEVVLIK